MPTIPASSVTAMRRWISEPVCPLYSLLALEEAGPAISPDAVLEIPQIQLSFEDRGELANSDRQIIKDLGFKTLSGNRDNMRL